MVTVLATCQYRTVQVIVTVKNNQILTTIDSLQFTDNNGEVFDKLWLSRSETNFVNVACFPDNAYSDYTDGYQWISLNPSVAVVESTGQVETDEYQRAIRGVAAGETQIQASLGIGEKIKTRTFDVKVCNAVTSISITKSYDGTDLPINQTIDINYTISDAAAAAEFGDRLTWHLVPSSGWNPEGGIESYVTITQDGKLTTHKDTPTGKTFSISAQIIHPKYPGHPTDNTNITVTSNEISSLKILPASTAIEFNPTSISYNYGSEGDLWTEVIFIDAEGNKLEIIDNDWDNEGNDDFKIAGTYNFFDLYRGVSMNYIPSGGTNSKLTSGTIEVIANANGTYTYKFNLQGNDTLVGTSSELNP